VQKRTQGELLHFAQVFFVFTLCPVAHTPDTVESLWRDYAAIFRDFDDLTLARWLAQTLSQLHGRLWRMSHPLVASYHLAAMIGHDRQIWHQRLIGSPPDYPLTNCCRAPLLPMVTREVLECGLICIHCNGSAVDSNDIPDKVLAENLAGWAEEYAAIHGVAHWDEERKRNHNNYEQAFEDAAQKSEQLLSKLGSELAPPLLEFFPAVIWDDQDECLQVRPEDIAL
tara:strand:- start:234 stop:911 length:678 start_codon:yes stop_codon:yes gene_type:complete